jgi:hypothetical protein
LAVSQSSGGRFVKTLPAFAIAGIAAAALAGTAIAAKPQTHVMDVPLPDGSVVHIEYIGDVAPKVTVAPAPMAGIGYQRWTPMGMPPLPPLAGPMSGRAMRLPGQPGPFIVMTPDVASFGNMPAGVTSRSVVSVSNGAGTCTRTTQVESQGPGKPPKVTTNATGNCGAEVQPAPGGAPSKAPTALDRT